MTQPFKFCIFDIGQVCYPYSLTPLNNYIRSLVSNPHQFDIQGGIKSFNYHPFMKGEINFSQFCKDVCSYSQIDYSAEIQTTINTMMHLGVGEFYPETLMAMQQLRSHNIEICLLSNALPNLSDTVSNLTDKNKIFTSYQLGLLKPNPQIYTTVLQKLHAKPQEVIFIDDKPTNTTVAQTLGIKSIVFKQKTICSDINNLLHD